MTSIPRTPNGYFLLQVGDHRHVIIGGPFDAFNGGYGVCLEKNSIKAKDADLLLDVPDFSAPTKHDLEQTLVTIVEFMLARPEVPVYIGCRGGIGRTGMLMAALVRAVDLDPIDPAGWSVGWVRKHYLPDAVETLEQKRLVEKFDIRPVQSLIRHRLTQKTDLHRQENRFVSTMKKMLSWSR